MIWVCSQLSRSTAGLALLLGAAAAIPALAADSKSSRLDFQTTILPILTKAGCNAGACHGAATGQGGFHLSLLGYDPAEDYLAITRQRGGRRIDLQSPAESLLLRKPSRQLEHEGGRRLPRDSEGYQTVLRWISSGVKYGPSDLKVERIEVSPIDQLFRSTNQQSPLRVTAHLSNGSREEVTALALYNSNDEAVAEVNGSGQVTVRGRGATSIMVRYGGQVAAARIAIPFAAEAPAAFDFPSARFIDRQIAAELKRLHLAPSPLSSDAEFLRRIYLDLTGQLPAADVAKNFQAEPASTPGKREQVIDALLQSEAFADFWTLKFADLLLITEKRGRPQGARTYHYWLREQLAGDKGWDQIARALLTAEGDTSHIGPANFFHLATDPRDLAEQASDIFLGTRIACARCHAHPADRWTQEDYHQFAAFFARVVREGEQVKAGSRGEVEHPKSARAMTPRPLGSAAELRPTEGDRRLVLADWVASPQNPFFARALVNRVWQQLLGRGLVEPVNDLRPTNPATHPVLLDGLAADFASHQFNLRWLIREIVSSRTYQLTSRPEAANAQDDRFYSHGYLKPLPAQVLVDAIAQATGVADQFNGYPTGTRAVQLVGTQTPSYALDVLGRCARERNCESPGRSGGGLAQALHLINGQTINAKLQRGILPQLRARNLSDRELLETLFYRTLSRPAQAAELELWLPRLGGGGQGQQVLEDLLWVLLNSREFAFNH